MPTTPRTLGQRLLDFLWPRRCVIGDCDRPITHTPGYLCPSCKETLPWYEAGGYCYICGAAVTAETHHQFVCEACQRKRPAFDKAVSAVCYLTPIPELIKAFKFHAATHLAEDLTDCLEKAVRERLDIHQIDVVMAIPLHPTRLRERGYNQSEILAQALARRLDRRYEGSSLTRIFNTEHQTRINGEARRCNLEGCFHLHENATGLLRGRNILLIDDVMTTGATLNECSLVLRTAKPAHIWCATVARSLLET